MITWLSGDGWWAVMMANQPTSRVDYIETEKSEQSLDDWMSPVATEHCWSLSKVLSFTASCIVALPLLEQKIAVVPLLLIYNRLIYIILNYLENPKIIYLTELCNLKKKKRQKKGKTVAGQQPLQCSCRIYSDPIKLNIKHRDKKSRTSLQGSFWLCKPLLQFQRGCEMIYFFLKP